MAKTEERQMQVEVNNGPVLILPRWKNHLKGTQVETLQQEVTPNLYGCMENRGVS